MMAGRTPTRKTSGTSSQDSGEGSYITETRTSKQSYTGLRPAKVRPAEDQVDSAPPLPDSGSNLKSVLVLALVFSLALVALGFTYIAFPKLDNKEYQYIKLPRDIEDAKNLGRVLSRYTDKYFSQVLLAFFVTYIFLQTFAIPGSIFLSIISGYLYAFTLALPLVCLCSAVGASLCYLLSKHLAATLVQRCIPDRAASWKQRVDHHRENLFFYLLFLRITPLLPNWFINITSPHINVPLKEFFFGTALGVAPPSIFFINAGKELYRLTSHSQVMTWNSLGLLFLSAFISLLPVLFKKRLREKFD